MDCEHLIDLVRNNTYLYDKGKKGSADKDLIAYTWQTISQMIEGNYTALECERKWKLLRERYTREHRMYMNMKEHFEDNLQNSDNTEAPEEPHWEYYQALKFLDQHIKHKRTITHINQTIQKPEEMNLKYLEFVDTPLRDTLSVTTPIPHSSTNRKRRKPHCDPLDAVKCELTFSPPSPAASIVSHASSNKEGEVQQRGVVEDSDELFGRLVAAELRKVFDDELKRRKKRDILNILYT